MVDDTSAREAPSAGIPTREALFGFIASEPKLGPTDNGGHRLYIRVGIEQSEPNGDGTFTELEPQFTDLVMFNKSAERAALKFQKGDHFIAVGRTAEHDYQGETRRQFIASRIGHDNNRTSYTVDRSRAERTMPEHDAPARAAGERDPAAVALAQREQDLAADTSPAQPAGANREAIAR
ncbi:single-stranded DNA-binding protein [Microbacterium sp. 22303]|uniref:single-stranded DNA-binding protein n=1 Tax=Microbacterium sp. 22303 TaxID=3453905 RepID=UPI003F826262